MSNHPTADAIVRRMINVRIFKSTEALISQTLNLLCKTLPTTGNLMLSGGSTPYAIYNRLAAAPCSVHPDRKLFLSDERLVPFDSEKNNAYNLGPMLHALECEDRFIRINTTLSPAEAATQFEAELQGLEKIDLGFLGMGNDGHTAGFFTPEQARLTSGPLTLHTARPDGMQGVSITPTIFQRVEKMILLVTGESKRAIIDTLLSQPQTIPAGIALAGHPNIELWTDQTPSRPEMVELKEIELNKAECGALAIDVIDRKAVLGVIPCSVHPA